MTDVEIINNTDVTMIEVAQEMLKSNKPVIKKIYDANGTKMLVVGLAKGVVFPEHIAPCEARLLVVQGEIDFNIKNESLRFARLESYQIPVCVKHSVVAWSDAIFLLILNENG